MLVLYTAGLLARAVVLLVIGVGLQIALLACSLILHIAGLLAWPLLVRGTYLQYAAWLAWTLVLYAVCLLARAVVLQNPALLTGEAGDLCTCGLQRLALLARRALPLDLCLGLVLLKDM
jgi:hypothetical protein